MSVSPRPQAEPVWVVDPKQPGPDLPPVGRSLFDHLIADQPVPFPFQRLIARIEARLQSGKGLDDPVKKALIPLGRSLQRESGGPAFFHYPRAVVAVDGENLASGPLLRDRLYLGYLEKAAVLEVISYNEQAARFEFQIVRDYRQQGQRQVHYAGRRLCTACHQNAAPLFARPLWNETNADERVADSLRMENREFYGFPVQIGVDAAYAIDNATDRANGFSLTQLLWQAGCGAGSDGRGCRAELLRRGLQFLLSDRRGYRRDDADFRLLVDRMSKIRQRRWPDGLWIPNPDVPNRKPFQQVAALKDAGADVVVGAASLFGESSIPARFEPLAPRPALETWNPAARDWTQRAIEGLWEFIGARDRERLDTAIASTPIEPSELALQCRVRAGAGSTRERRWKFDCSGDQLQLRGRIFRVAGGERSGYLSRANVAGDALGRLEIDCAPVSKTGEQGDLCIGRIHRGSHPGRVRLSNADALLSLILPLPREDAGQTPRSGRLLLRRDSQTLDAAIERMQKPAQDAWNEGPFQRSRVLASLYAALGMDPAPGCCGENTSLPPASTEPMNQHDQAEELASFYRVCGSCHRSENPFPPNFLAGDAQRVREQVSHCEPRIRYRLRMWDLDEQNRPKTPMPPQHALASLGSDPGRWRQGPTLQKLLSELGAADQIADAKALPEYTRLRPCLPPAPASP